MSLPIRHFRAHAEAPEVSAVLHAQSFEEAALEFVERLGGETDEIRITVSESATGERRCFSLHHDGSLDEGC